MIKNTLQIQLTNKIEFIKNKYKIKMKESNLLKIALICSLVGLIALYVISEKLEVKDYKPTMLSKNIGDDVKFKGTIRKIANQGNVVFIEVDQQNQVDVVAFAANNSLKLNRGDNIEIIGKVQEYNGKNEIVAQIVRVIK